MKKLIVSMLAVGALAAGGAASAQDVLGNVLPQILGNLALNNGYGYGYGYPGNVYTPNSGRAVPGSVVLDANGRPTLIAATGVAAMPGGTVVESSDGGQVTLDANGTYVDRFGQRIQVDQTGHQVPISGGGIAGLGGIAQSRLYNRSDRDGDGVPDAIDRYPYDPHMR